MKLLLATSNRGKLAELQELLKDTNLELTLPSDAGIAMPTVVEDGATYEANALKKARTLASISNQPALADDSGLEVDALGGAPGIQSARFSGGGDDANNSKLLAELAGKTVRKARFRCVLVLAWPDGKSVSAEGTWEGEIGTEKRGANGFGYDPVFKLPDGRHGAELSREEKGILSHRANAARNLVNKMRLNKII